jgi:hypothetical protein
LAKKRLDHPIPVTGQPVANTLKACCSQFTVAKQYCGKEIVLASKIRVDRPLGQLGPLGDAVQICASET